MQPFTYYQEIGVITMEYSQELTSALNELKRITGVTMDITVNTPEEAELALIQIRHLCTAYKEKYNKTHFLQSLMTGTISSYEASKRALRLHIEPEETRVLFLLETRGVLDDTATEVLRNLFPSQKTFLIPMADNRLAILRPLRTAESEQDMPRIARTIVDTLNTEALIHVQTAYSGILNHLSELSGAFRETQLALQVGKLFYSDQTVFPYNQLGVGRLIYQLPADICESFLKEIFGTDIPDMIDEETTATLERFMQNNLNIAETSRQLHMHRNTLIYRLEQVQKRTGLDLRKFEDAMTFKIATMVMNYLQTERNS